MAGIFLSKHQKLILQCYPPGKGIEKKPNSSELSYLLYYASTRRIKLDKVISFLNKKTISDSSRNKVGNLQVTLSIISALTEKCTDNLNVFAPKAFNILNLSLKNNDLSLAKATLQTYGILCKNLDGGLFAGDQPFVESFVSFSNKLIDVGIQNSSSSGPNKREWKMISLIASRYLTECLGDSPAICRVMLRKIIPILVETFYENDKTFSKFSTDGDSNKLSKIQSAMTTKSHMKTDLNLENDSVDDSDLYMEATETLKAIFNTSLTTQLVQATDTVVGYTYENSKFTTEWSVLFLELCSSWTPVQLRFELLNTLVGKLKQSSSDFNLQKHYANHILGLVSSNVNMIGLSVSDLIQNLLELKKLLFFSSGKNQQDKKELESILSNAIIDLSTHIYYFDQVPDSIYEIFDKIETTLELTSHKHANELYDYINSLLNDIDEIFDKLEDTNSDTVISRNHVGLGQWLISLPLISSKSSVKFYDHLSDEQVSNIQLSYLSLFERFLDIELNNETDVEQSDISDIDKDNLLTPDENNLISEPNNFLSQYLVYVDKYINKNDKLNPKIGKQLLAVTKLLVKIFGINFFNNFIPFYFHWNSSHLNDDSGLLKDTFAQIVLYDCLSNLDDKYESELNGYCKQSTFNSNVQSNIDYRINNGVWVNELEPKEATSSRSLVNLTISDLQEFVSGNAFLKKWLNPLKPLILSVLHDDFLSRAGTIKDSSSQNGHASEIRLNGNVSNGNGHVTETVVTNGQSNGHSNGHSNGIASSASSIGDEFHDTLLTVDDSINTTDYDRPNPGLGNNGDIASIHSGLRHHHTFTSTLSNQSYDLTNGSILTHDKKPVKVNDLKSMLSSFKSNLKKPSVRDDNSLTPGSILSKQMATRDVDSILDGLDDDDKIVV